MTLLVLPDAVTLTRKYLLTVTELTDLIDERISTRSASTPVYPYLTLQRIGGTSVVAERLDSARIQFDAWGATESDASVVIRTARAALFALNRVGGYVAAAGVLTGVNDIAGPQWLPDTTRDPHVPRFTSTLDIGARTP